MALAILVAPRAHRDVDECAAFIARDNLDAAMRFLDAYDAALSLLAEYPMSGAKYHAKMLENEEVRYISIPGHDKYMLFYTPLDDAVRVHRVIHSARRRNIGFE